MKRSSVAPSKARAGGATAALALAISIVACGAAEHASIGPTGADIPVRGGSPKTGDAPPGPRESPPPPLASKEAPFPKVTRTRLLNGLEVAVAEAHALPIVQLRVLIRAGNGYGGTPGAAELTAQLLKDGGTRSMTSAVLLNRIETLGADLSIDVDLDSTRLAVGVTKDHLGEALALVAEVVQAPALDDKELAKLKGRETDAAQDNARSNGTWTATRVLFRELYTQANPYSSYELVPSEIAKITPAIVKDFHKRYYVPKNVAVVLSGDVDAEKATRAVEKAFGAWKGGEPPKSDFPSAIALVKRRVIVAHRPKSAQSDVFVASLIGPRKAPDWAAIRVASQVLGGVPAGRLFLDVREQRSLAYSVRSSVIELANGEEPLVIYAGTQTPKTGFAVQGVLDGIARISSDAPSAAETESARRYLSDVFAIRMETVGSIADMIVQESVFGLPDGYWNAYRAELRSTEPANAAAAAAKMFHPDRALVVVAGDADFIAAPLTRFGEVTVVDPEHEFQTMKTLPMNADASLEITAPASQ